MTLFDLTQFDMRVEDAQRLAAAEGLSLMRADTVIGFKHVHRNADKRNPFKAQIRKDGTFIGVHASATDAALAVARFLKPTSCAHEPAAVPQPPMTQAEAERLAEEEGLELMPAAQRQWFCGRHQSQQQEQALRGVHPPWRPAA